MNDRISLHLSKPQWRAKAEVEGVEHAMSESERRAACLAFRCLRSRLCWSRKFKLGDWWPCQTRNPEKLGCCTVLSQCVDDCD